MAFVMDIYQNMCHAPERLIGICKLPISRHKNSGKKEGCRGGNRFAVGGVTAILFSLEKNATGGGSKSGTSCR
jgi:hypothetical protein